MAEQDENPDSKIIAEIAVIKNDICWIKENFKSSVDEIKGEIKKLQNRFWHLIIALALTLLGIIFSKFI